MINDALVYSRIGMALISAQRVEYIAGSIVEQLTEFGEIYGILTPDFLSNSQKSKNTRKMLGQIFQLLKLNPKLVIEEELDEYLKRRNLLVHGFWKNYLNTRSEEQAKDAVEFCNEFGKLSDRVESFFKGFLYFLAMRHVKDRDYLEEGIKSWNDDFEYFMLALRNKRALLDDVKD